ncbi:MAG: hypothetical protein PHH30_10305 [Bacteroidales bacterium]|nr:hypothetical protein [Bacteroidales bacterium]MDD3860832.1 hypothetical protein [Bacteroidales bacterium]
MKKAIVIFTLFCSLSSIAQSYVSLEVGGSGGLGSINYENTFITKSNFSGYYRVGFSFAPIDKNNGVALIFPLMIHELIGSSDHKIDLGIGPSLSITTKGNVFTLMAISAGYRFQPQNKNYYIRIAYTPIVSFMVDFQVQHWAGLCFGYKI